MLHDLTIRTFARYLVGKNGTLHKLMQLNKRFYSLRLSFINSLKFFLHYSNKIIADKPFGWNHTYSLELSNYGDGSTLKDCQTHRFLLYNCPHFKQQHLSLLRSVHHLNLSVLHQITDLSVLANSQIKHIKLGFLPYFVDLRPLISMKTITLFNCNQITDLSPLNKSNVKGLAIVMCHGITDVSPLANIHSVILSSCDNITDVSCFIKGSIRYLTVEYCKNITDISTLKLNNQLTITFHGPRY